MNTPARRDIPAQYKWKLEDIFLSSEKWKEQADALPGLARDAACYKGRLGESPDTLIRALDAYAACQRAMEAVYVYAFMLRDQDNRQEEPQALADRAEGLNAQVSAELSFLTPELLTVDPAVLDGVRARRPDYARFLDETERARPHTLSEREETLLAQAGEMAQTAQTAFRMLQSADMRFLPVDGQPLSHGKYIPLLQSPDREIRKKAFESYYAEFLEHRNTLAALYAGSVKKDLFFARARRFSSSREDALYPDEVDGGVYDGLIAAVRNRLPALNRYMGLRKKLLSVGELHMYDLYVPLVGEMDIKISYDEAKEQVLEALKPLGEEFGKGLRAAFDGGWIDVMESEGKTPGAYSWGCYDSHPYVLLNWQGRLDDAFTLAHELGHALHSYLSNAHQPYINASYRIFVAEVASTMCECLFLRYRLERARSDREKAYLYNYLLEQFRTTMFRQVMFAEFEHQAHGAYAQGQALTPDFLSAKYKKLNEDYYGADTVIDDQIAVEWARIPHFYTAFYVYQYATGFAAAVALSQMVLKSNEGALSFLKAGGSDAPLNILKKAGVDLSGRGPIELALDLFEKTLSDFEALMLPAGR